MARPQALRESLPGLWRIFRHFWPWIRRQRRLILSSLLALFAGIILRLLEPWPLKFVLDHIVPAQQTSDAPGLSFIGSLDPVTLATLAAFAVVTISGLRAVADYSNKVGFALIGNRVLSAVRADLYRHLQQLSLSFHHKARGGDLIVRVISDVNMLRDVTAGAVLPLLANVLVLFGMVLVMVWLEWRLTLLALATMPLFWLTTLRLSRRIHQSARKQRRREAAMAATAAESITAIKTVKALSLEGIFAADFCGRNEESQKQDIRASKLSARLGRTVDFLLAIGTALVLWYGALLVMRGTMTLGDLVVFLTYLRRAFHPAQDFAKYTARLSKAAAAGERVLELLQRTPDVRDLPGAIPATAFRGNVRFEQVSFGYEPGRLVLEEIDFAVEPGQHVALVGPSGIGKSTLISLLLRLYDPVHGRILMDGHDIREYTLASLRAQVSVVLQDTLLFAASVRDNISYGATNATRAEIEIAARLANAHEFIQALPEGYDTVLGERGVTLSHGQRQRIAIARAAVRKSAILVLDEPTTGLDEENERAVLEALDRLAEGRTTFLVTHNLSRASRADLIVYLENARLLECGTHERLLQKNGRYATLFRLQAFPETSSVTRPSPAGVAGDGEEEMARTKEESSALVP